MNEQADIIAESDVIIELEKMVKQLKADNKELVEERDWLKSLIQEASLEDDQNG